MIRETRDEEVEKIRVAVSVRRPVGWCTWCKYFGVFGYDEILKKAASSVDC